MFRKRNLLKLIMDKIYHFLITYKWKMLLFLFVIYLAGIFDVKSKYTIEQLKEIQLGMRVEEVVKILGRPLSILNRGGNHKIECNQPRIDFINVDKNTDIRSVLENFDSDTSYCCIGYKESFKPRYYTLTFTEKSHFAHPMLWVHLDSTFSVFIICQKQYDGLLGLDDPITYYLGKN
jgi:hypothetical protein